MNFLDLFDFKGVIFDLDGTLIDSLSLWSDIDIAFFKKYNMNVPKDYSKKIQHMNFYQMAEFTIKEYNLKTTPDEVISFWNSFAINEYKNIIKTKPYVKEYLQLLKDNNIKISLATTNKKEIFYSCLVSNDIEKYFDCILNVNDLNTSKSEPKIYLEASKRMNLDIEDTLVFEDLLLPIKTAKAVGFKVIAVDDKHNYLYKEDIKLNCNYYRNSYEELIK